MKAKDAFVIANCDKGYVHQYDRYYDKIFADYVPNSLLEIGVSKGKSLVSWRLMFPDCDITGIDITNKFFVKKFINFSQASIILGDSTNPNIVNHLDKSYDVIIDDGSHYYRDIARTFKNLHTKFNKYYIIEDFYYDIGLALKYINRFGFYDITVRKSKNSNILIKDKKIFTHKTTQKSRCIDQNFIIIRR